MEQQQIEDTLREKGKTAPMITKEDFENNIIHTEVVKHITHSGQVLRWAVLTTKSEFSVTGKPSASVSAENDVAEVGESVAISNAKQELWVLMGYHLKCQLAGL